MAPYDGLGRPARTGDSKPGEAFLPDSPLDPRSPFLTLFDGVLYARETAHRARGRSGP